VRIIRARAGAIGSADRPTSTVRPRGGQRADAARRRQWGAARAAPSNAALPARQVGRVAAP